jgi:hypothetical protein
LRKIYLILLVLCIFSVFLEISLKAFVCYFAISLRNSATDANLPWKKRTLIPREFSLDVSVPQLTCTLRYLAAYIVNQVYEL